MSETTIYIVTEGCYSDYGIEGVFSTYDLAEAYRKDVLGEDEYPSGDVEEWTLDDKAGWVKRTCYFHHIEGRASGKYVLANQYTLECVGSPQARMHTAKDSGLKGSFVSPEHATKLSVERIQELQRAQPDEDAQGSATSFL